MSFKVLHIGLSQSAEIGLHMTLSGAGTFPYIPHHILLRYSDEGGLVLDQFSDGGTTLVEAKLLNRDTIGIDVNDTALERCRKKLILSTREPVVRFT